MTSDMGISLNLTKHHYGHVTWQILGQSTIPRDNDMRQGHFLDV